MIIRIYTIILFSILSCAIFAQGDANMQLNKSQNSYSFERNTKRIFDIEYANWYALRSNPAFHHYFSEENDKHFDFKELKDKNIVTGNFNYSKTTGEHFFDAGNKQNSTSVAASGKMTIKNVGTLFGSASYTNENKKNTLLNYAINPENYYPYLVSDTLGVGSKKYESYYINGGFSFAHKGIYYGIGAVYQGIASSKLTDPRLSIYDSWFRLDFGISKAFNRHFVAAKIYPEFNRQTISASSSLFKAPSVLHFNGLGNWRSTEVKATQGYEQLLTISGFGTEMSYQKQQKTYDDLGYSFNLSYNYRKMNTEDNSQLGFESNTKLNLFSKNSHHINPTLSVSKNFKKMKLIFLIAGRNTISKGTEHIYKSEKVSGEQNLFDYIKVASNAFYTQYAFVNSASLKFMLPVGNIHSYHLLTSIEHKYYEEKYVYPSKKIKNASLTPSLGIGYNGVFKRNNLALNLVYSQQLSLQNSYDIPEVQNWIRIQQGYIPFLIRSENHYKIQSDVSYSYTLTDEQSIGARASLSYLNRTKTSKQKEDIVYMPARNRNILLLDFSLFYLF